MHEIFRSLSWPFERAEFPPSLGAVVQWTVANGEFPALYVGDTEDNSWLVGDGVNDPNAAGTCAAVCIWAAITRNSSMRGLADLPPGWAAERDAPGDPWRRAPFPVHGLSLCSGEPAHAQPDGPLYGTYIHTRVLALRRTSTSAGAGSGRPSRSRRSGCRRPRWRRHVAPTPRRWARWPGPRTSQARGFAAHAARATGRTGHSLPVAPGCRIRSWGACRGWPSSSCGRASCYRCSP